MVDGGRAPSGADMLIDRIVEVLAQGPLGKWSGAEQGRLTEAATDIFRLVQAAHVQGAREAESTLDEWSNAQRALAEYEAAWETIEAENGRLRQEVARLERILVIARGVIAFEQERAAAASSGNANGRLPTASRQRLER